MEKRGLTLIELVVVIIIIAILAVLGYTQYQKTMEKARSAEAKTTLSHIRESEWRYYERHDTFTSVEANLDVDEDLWSDCADQTDSFFRFWVLDWSADQLKNGFAVRAQRCTSGGKNPAASQMYEYHMDKNGVITCSVSSATPCP